MPEPDYRLLRRRTWQALAVGAALLVVAWAFSANRDTDSAPRAQRPVSTSIVEYGSRNVSTTTVRVPTTVRRATTTRRVTSEAECRRMAGGIVADNQAFMDSLAGMQTSLLAGDLAGAGVLYGWADSELFVLEASFDEFRDECRSHFPEETRRAEALLRDMRRNWAEATKVCRESLEPLGLAMC